MNTFSRARRILPRGRNSQIEGRARPPCGGPSLFPRHHTSSSCQTVDLMSGDERAKCSHHEHSIAIHKANMIYCTHAIVLLTTVLRAPSRWPVLCSSSIVPRQRRAVDSLRFVHKTYLQRWNLLPACSEGNLVVEHALVLPGADEYTVRYAFCKSFPPSEGCINGIDVGPVGIEALGHEEGRAGHERVN